MNERKTRAQKRREARAEKKRVKKDSDGHANSSKGLVTAFESGGKICSGCWDEFNHALTKEEAQRIFQILISEDQKIVNDNGESSIVEWTPFIDSADTVHWKVSNFSGPMFNDLVEKAEVQYIHILDGSDQPYMTPVFAMDESGTYIYAVVMPAEMFFGTRGEFVYPVIIRSKEFFPIKTMKLHDEMLAMSLRDIPMDLRVKNRVYRAMAGLLKEG